MINDGRKDNGGSRVGAGRPKESIKKVVITRSVLPETAEAIKVLAPNKKSEGQIIDKAIKKLLESE